MIVVKVADFTSALAKMTGFISSSNPNIISGVLIDIADTTLKIAFSDGTKSIIEEIDCDATDETIRGRIVTPYNRLVDIISGCQPKGGIETEDICMELTESDSKDVSNVLKITVSKKVKFRNNSEGEAVSRTSSIISQSTTWCRTTANKKVKLLDTGDYEVIFNTPEGAQVDQWDCKELKEILARTSTESGKTSYIISEKQVGFAANSAHASVIPIKAGEYGDHTIFVSIPTSIAKSIIDVINKLSSDQDKLNLVNIDNRRLIAFTDDMKVGFWTDMAPSNRTHMSHLNQYMARVYNNYQLTFNRESLQDAVESALASGKEQKTTLEFGDSVLEEGKVEMRISANDSAASVSNNYGLLCWSCVDTVGDIRALKISVSLKVFLDMISNCNSTLIGLDISAIEEESKRYIRVAEVDGAARKEVAQQLIDQLDITSVTEIPASESVKTRDATLLAKHYNVAK